MNEDNNLAKIEQEWSHFVIAEDIADKPLNLTIEPNEEQIEALERRLDLVRLSGVVAKLTLTRTQGGHSVHVRGNVSAHVVQKCVVTLDPVDDVIEEDFEAWFADPDQAVSLTRIRHDKKSKGERPVLSESDDPEPMIDGQVDVGELVTQYLSLALNPYPHAEGVSYQGGDSSESDDTGGPNALKNPFAALKEWKDRQR